jgi:cytochrome b subunit of formate dehydrogenase
MLFWTNRDRKINYLSMLINSIIFTIAGISLFNLSMKFMVIVIFFVFVFVLQFFVFLTPMFLKGYILKSLHPKDKTKELEKKIAMIKEEIKYVNGEDYNEDVFFDD